MDASARSDPSVNKSLSRSTGSFQGMLKINFQTYSGGLPVFLVYCDRRFGGRVLTEKKGREYGSIYKFCRGV